MLSFVILSLLVSSFTLRTQGWTVQLMVKKAGLAMPEFQGDADRFDPSRWLEDGAPLKKEPKGFMPFGEGPRKCLGMLLAKMEMRVWAPFPTNNALYWTTEVAQRCSDLQVHCCPAAKWINDAEFYYRFCLAYHPHAAVNKAVTFLLYLLPWFCLPEGCRKYWISGSISIANS